MSIDELKQTHTKACLDLHMAVQPLRDRLHEMGMFIFWRDNEYRIADCIERYFGYKLPLDNVLYSSLMSMTNSELRAFCKELMA